MSDNEDIVKVSIGDKLSYSREDSGGMLFTGKFLQPGVEYIVVEEPEKISEFSVYEAGRLLKDGVLVFADSKANVAVNEEIKPQEEYVTTKPAPAPSPAQETPTVNEGENQAA